MLCSCVQGGKKTRCCEIIPLLSAVNMFSKLPSRNSIHEGSANINSPSIHAKPSSKNGKTKSWKTVGRNAAICFALEKSHTPNQTANPPTVINNTAENRMEKNVLFHLLSSAIRRIGLASMYAMPYAGTNGKKHWEQIFENRIYTHRYHCPIAEFYQKIFSLLHFQHILFPHKHPP